MNKPLIGEIWIVVLPIFCTDEKNNISISLQKRPCLVLDDGRGLIVEEDRRNYHVFKLTSQYDPYRRKEIKNWRKIGLKKKSFVRIELPIKIEEHQFVAKVADLPTDQLKEMYTELYKILNIQALEKIAKDNVKN